MKKILLGLLFTAGAASAFAQNYPGYRTGNFTGVNGAFFNPASIADSRYRWDVNLFSFNAGVVNNNGSFKLKNISDQFDNNNFTNQLYGGANLLQALGNVDVHGPSVMFNTGRKTAFALTTRLRSMVNVVDADGRLLQNIADAADTETYPFAVRSNSNSRIKANGWAEVGATFAHVFADNGRHFFKAGITPKYLRGVGNNSIQLDRVNGELNRDATGKYLQNSTGTIGVSTAGYSLDDIDLADLTKSSTGGFGGDIGFVYEFRPAVASSDVEEWRRDLNKYQWRFGASLVDLGKINYKRNTTASGVYNVNIDGTEKQYLKELDGLSTTELRNYFDSRPTMYTRLNGSNDAEVQTSLPSMLNLDVDYNIGRGFFLNGAAELSVVDKGKIQNPFMANTFSLTPRYEGKAFGVYVPLSYNSISDFNAGLSLRAGPVFIGSGSVLTALVGKSKQADVHFGLRFGVPHKKKTVREVITQTITETVVVNTTKDMDNDGIVDSLDKCPSLAGVLSAAGCPDADGDNIADADDKCPTTAGLTRYAGCPIPDTDNDGINDEADKCISLAGTAKYEGCPIPDTDNDGINDEEDKCPQTAGIASNFGCPEIKKDVIKKIEFAAQHLYFATGKALILKKSNAGLITVAKLMKADPSLKLEIDGHTDNVGTEESNQALSEARAEAAKAYLVKQGVDESRISTVGYGETKPIADNKTAAGRAKNRRSEFKVSNY